MNQFCEIKGIMRQYMVARTPQQNKVAKRKNRTLIEAARTMLADSKLPTTFWEEAVNTACYVQNRVLVVKPCNKTPYELFHGRTPALSFVRPFGCPLTILNTKDHFAKFNGKADKGLFVGYSLNSKAFRVFNSRTRIVEENLHIRFSENTSNIAGSGPNWLFYIDALTKSMNYKPVVAGNQSNSNASTKACDDARKARMEIVPGKDYILLPLWTADPLISQESKSSQDDVFQPSIDDEKKVDEDPRQESKCKDPEKEDNVNSTNNVNDVGTNGVNVVGTNTNNELPFDPEIPALEDISTFNFLSGHEDDDEMADINNLDITFQVSPTPTIRIHKDHPIDQVIRYLHSTTQTRNMSKNLEERRWMSRVFFSMKRLKKMYMFANLQDLKILTFLIKCKKLKKHYMDFIKLLEHEVKNASTPMKTQKPLLKDEDGEEVDVHMYRSMIGSLMYLTSLRLYIIFVVCTCERYHVNIKVSHLHVVKRIFKYLKGQPKFDLWYLKDSPFDLVAYTDSDYAGASLDRKSTTRGYQFLRCRLISWQCKKQIVVANSIT
nr:ribonuclease H-like domain-containing protein [Tanacetum cinerariifolium]GEZ17417.1 ribonuclease H-like domain-containing protein [Tanacetum cinerariifolium]